MKWTRYEHEWYRAVGQFRLVLKICPNCQGSWVLTIGLSGQEVHKVHRVLEVSVPFHWADDALDRYVKALKREYENDLETRSE